eukprot:gb/GEZN01003289.1/.p1 GENE.gb/GEZN01003289.1/~~gb/GEZN01003289.1/.p1  ORF type:complete len:582 (-),score=64.83 gb/GEZN01003289.1/:470-2188(-)
MAADPIQLYNSDSHHAQRLFRGQHAGSSNESSYSGLEEIPSSGWRGWCSRASRSMRVATLLMPGICLVLFLTVIGMGAGMGLMRKQELTIEHIVSPSQCQVPGAQETWFAEGLHADLRRKTLAQLQAQGAPLENAGILLQGGSVQNQYYSDTELYFRQESNFLYLCGFQLPPYMGPSLILVLSNSTQGYAILFIGRPSLMYSIWNGVPMSKEEVGEMYGVDAVYYTDEFAALLPTLYLASLHVLQTAGFEPATQAALDGSPGIELTAQFLKTALDNARARKTEQELSLLRLASQVSTQAHLGLMALAASGQLRYEYQAAMAFVQISGSCGGWSHQAYLPIVGAGPRSAVLHYVTAYEAVQNHDMLLVDAGSEFLGYVTDITRTFPVSGVFSPIQRKHYEIVFKTHLAVRDLHVQGAQYSAIARAASLALISALLEAGLAKGGTVDELYAAKIDGVFMPHGLGHFVGLDVHDPQSPQRLTPPSNLTAGMVLTCEPGVYFIPDQLADALADPFRAVFLDAQVIQQYLDEPGVGGVRIEDVLLVMPGGAKPEILSSGLPTSPDEIEAFFKKQRGR